MKYTFYAFLITIAVVSACSSGKSTFERGNYYEAVITSVNRLRKNSDHKKSVETLRQAYPMAVRYYEDRANTSIASAEPFRWSHVVNAYTTINHMYDEIKRCPGALRVVPDPVNYFSKLQEAKTNAADENYTAGITALQFKERDKAKQAYTFFKTAHNFVPGYKDVISYMEAALNAATVKVLVEPVPVHSKSVGVSAEFFNDKISEFVHAAPINEFVRFYTLEEAKTIKLSPDHIIQLQFDDFTVGQVYKHEKEIQLTKDSVVMGTYVTPATASQPNNDGGKTNLTGRGSLNVSGTGVLASSQNKMNTSTSPNTTSPVPNSDADRAAREQAKKESVLKAQMETAEKARIAREAAEKEAAAKALAAQENANREAAEKLAAQALANKAKAEREAAGKTKPEIDPTINSSDTMNVTDPVTICHIPPGNKMQRRTLVISRSALKAHLGHGDIEGDCEGDKTKDKNQKENKGQPLKELKGKPGQGSKGKGPGASNERKSDSHQHARAIDQRPGYLILASADQDPMKYLRYADLLEEADTNKVYSTVKATLYHHKKTTTAKGVVSFRILDAKTGALLSAEKMPGEFVWVSEWATFNGDERALSSEQLGLTRLKELPAPAPQELFIEFTRPIYDQITGKIKDFYRSY